MSKKYTPEELRAFYFSKATKFSAHENQKQKQKQPDTTPSAKTAQRESAASTPDPATISAITTKTTPIAASSSTPTNEAATTTKPASAAAAKKPVSATPATPTAQGSAVHHAKKQQNQSASAQQSTHYTADSVAPEYIQFLRQQQDLVKFHHEIEATLQSALDTANEFEKAHFTDAAAAADLLAVSEKSTEWNWKSKFNTETLIRDVGLEVEQSRLCHAEDIPKVIDLKHQHQQLVKLRQDFCSGSDDKGHFALLLDNGIRRVDRLIAEYGASQSDAEVIVRLSDNLLVQLDQVMSIQPLGKVLHELNGTIAALEARYKECQNTRDQAWEDGTMDVAEAETFRLADLGEELAAAQCEKIRLLNNIAEENRVADSVRQKYSDAANGDAAAENNANTDLKRWCEEDLARLYAVKRDVDDTENEQVEKWNADREASDAKLKNIHDRQKEAWDQIQMLVRQIKQLEDERYVEYKRRVEEKIKDESRRNEYGVFTKVASEYSAMLDRTIKNCDIRLHSTKLMLDFLNSGFGTIEKDLAAKRSEVESELLAAHKNHLEAFRNLLFTLGDLEYKKEKRVNEISENIKQAHIQQELCADSLNPNAKKFSDAKKQLLRVRDDLENEVRDLRDRQQGALAQYAPTEAALNKANFKHPHPMEELEDRRLATREKMNGYKTMALGTVSTAPIRAELEALQKSFNDSRAAASVPRAARAAAAAQNQQQLNNTAPL